VNAPYTTTEGGSVTLTTNVTPLGVAGQLQGPVTWDMNGDGRFDDAFGSTVTLPWANLRSLGLNDNGAYQIAARATNVDGFTAEAFTSLPSHNTAPALTLADNPVAGHTAAR